MAQERDSGSSLTQSVEATGVHDEANPPSSSMLASGSGPSRSVEWSVSIDVGLAGDEGRGSTSLNLAETARQGSPWQVFRLATRAAREDCGGPVPGAVLCENAAPRHHPYHEHSGLGLLASGREISRPRGCAFPRSKCGAVRGTDSTFRLHAPR
jgi:hypothetical protein